MVIYLDSRTNFLVPENPKKCIFFKCSRCKSTYVCVTKRRQKVCFSEHILMNPHTGMLDDLTTLSVEVIIKETEIKESIMIKILKATLNDNTASKELFLFK